MGFGSYDESEQRDIEVAIDEGDGSDSDLHANDHEGTMSFESGGSTTDLLEELGRIKAAADEE